MSRLTRAELAAARWLLGHPGAWSPAPVALAAACSSLADRGLVERGAIGFYRASHRAHTSSEALQAAVDASAPPGGWVVLARADDLSSARGPASRERGALVWWSREDAERVALDVGGAVVAVEIGEVGS